MIYDQTANIYTPNPTTGAYDVLAKSSLACRLAYTQTYAQRATGPERVELAQGRRLMWEEDYTMSEDAQIEVDGQRFNVRAGTLGQLRGPSGQVVYRRCDVIEATS